jgi:hypothetical protein
MLIYRHEKVVFRPDSDVKFLVMKDKDIELIETFENAADGLEYISETDAPFTPFVSDEPLERTTAALKKFLKLGGKKLEEITFEEFFERLTRSREWHQAADKKQIAKYKKLRSALEANLEDLCVLRSGRLHIDVYIVGFLPDNRAAGIRTQAIET